jgi:peptide-O-fucosyltransferase
MCRPSEEIIVKQLRSAIDQVKAKSVFVASDHDHMIDTLGKHFGQADVIFRKLEDSDPHLDLVVLGRADLFVGNCVSSFSAFVKRERDVAGLPSSFWAFPTDQAKTHDATEL